MMDERASVGVVRRVDSLGRIVVPSEIGRRFGLEPGTPLAVFIDADDALIVPAPLQSSCTFCGSAEDLERLHGKPVCASCRTELARRA